jgi:hypothetical protein
MSTEYNTVISMISSRDVSFKEAMFTIAVAAMCATPESRHLLINTHKHLLEETLGNDEIHCLDMDQFKPVVVGQYASPDIDYDEYPEQKFFWYDGKCFADIHCKEELDNINCWRFI